MEFKHSPDDELVPRHPNGFVPIDEVADSSAGPDEALMEKDERAADPDGADEATALPVEVGDEEPDPTPQAWETHPAMEGVPYVAQNPGSEVSDRGAAEEEDLDRKTLLEKLREWWGKDQNVSRNPSHVPKKDLPKGAQTIRGTDWTSSPADEAFSGAGDETRNAA